MRTSLLSKELWSFVEKGFNESKVESQLTAAEKGKFEANRMSDAKALSKIQDRVSSTIFLRIIRARTAKEAWGILQQDFQGDREAISIKLQRLTRDFENLKMEGKSVKDYFYRVNEVVNQMRIHGEDISDEKIVQRF